MTIRKYLVTVHKDGHVTALEYEEPSDMTLTNYQAGERDAIQAIADKLERHKKAYDREARVLIVLGRIDEAKESVAKAHALYYAIQEIRREFKL